MEIQKKLGGWLAVVLMAGGGFGCIKLVDFFGGVSTIIVNGVQIYGYLVKPDEKNGYENYVERHNGQSGFYTVEDSDLRKSDGRHSDLIKNLGAGVRVVFLKDCGSDEWCNVSVPQDGVMGYVLKRKIRKQ